MAEIAARVDLDPRMWCRPVVNAAINPDPLTCWLALATAAPDSYPTTLTGMNMGDQPPFSNIDLEQLNAELTRYEQALEAERLEAERLEAERQAAEAARRARATPTRRTPTPGAGSTCGVKPGDIPTDAQLACMFGGGGGSSGGSSGGGDPYDDTDDYPPPEEYVWEPVEGYNPLPPPPTDCPNGWWYDSKTGYECL